MIEIATFKMDMPLDDAKLYVFSMGDGWRLPTLTECDWLHKKQLLDNFNVWIAESDETAAIRAELTLMFPNGSPWLSAYRFDLDENGSPGYKCAEPGEDYVGLLPVRDSSNYQLLDRNQFGIPLDFEVSSERYELKCKYEEAIDYCNNLKIDWKSGWRLPTENEMSKLSVLNYKTHGIFGHYWIQGGDQVVYSKHSFFKTDNEKLKHYTRVRPVRNR